MIEPNIDFHGIADEAIQFYETVFGGTDKLVIKYPDLPSDSGHTFPDERKNRVLHGRMNICGTGVCFCDTEGERQPGNMLSLILRFDTPEEAAAIYPKLAEGGEILMKLEPQHFAKAYAWVKDKFGVGWQLICENHSL